MSKVTIFAAPKPFVESHTSIIQRNAARSWKMFGPDVQVILIGDEPGIKDTAVDLGIQHIPNVEMSNEGTPLLSSIFSLARQASNHDILIYLNADIIILPETMDVINKILQLNKDFLIVGRRWDLNITKEIVFDSDWSKDIRAQVEKDGILQNPTALDYFIFPKNLYQEIPRFAVGRSGWDNWMIYHGMRQDWPVIDGTPSLMFVHQNHGYGHLPDGAPPYRLEETLNNMKLAGGDKNLYNMIDVSLKLENGKISHKLPTIGRLLRKLELIVTPSERKGRRWMVTLFLRRLQRKINKNW